MWTREELINIQNNLSRNLIITDLFTKPIRKIGGVDLSFIKDYAVVAFVCVNYENFEIIEKKTVLTRLDFPYRPGFLWFREGPPIVRIIKSLDVLPDIFMINAHGLAHPRRFGCASHVGVNIEKPTIGIAGSKLFGEVIKIPRKFGDAEQLKSNNETIGYIIKPKIGKPIYVSPGHMISLESTVKITINCFRNHRLPEPLYLSHRLAESRKRKIIHSMS
jgi:deoxyribonuclease V